MNEIFGLSMTYIMIALLCVLAVALAVIGYVLLRNRIMFLVGVRNIPRRRAQTILIIIGLMLSTLIISTAFSIGDTVDYSITNQAYSRLASIDETVQAQAETNEDDPFEGIGSFISALPIPEDRAQQFVERIREVDGVDGATAVMRGAVAVSNPAKGQTEPILVLIGLPSGELAGFSEVQTLDGKPASVDSLGRDEIFVNESAADELSIEPGDTLTIYAAGRPHEFRAKAILKDRVLTGSVAGISQGMLLSMDRVQELFEREGEVDFIAVSNDGGTREGVELSDEVADRINDSVLAGTDWTAGTTKKDFVETAEETSSFVVTFFVILGLFSIASGMMLVFLIFVMLAAERKAEMGMVRAVGTKRTHLVQMFMSEGMVYNVGAAAVGCALGIGVSVIMVGIMARLFADFDISISFHVTPRSLIVSYAIGVVLTFLTVTVSSWRIANLNIVSAIRDTPDPVTQEQRPSGVLSTIRWVFVKPAGLRQFLLSLAVIVGGGIAVALGIAMFMGGIAVYDDSTVNGVLAVLLCVFGGFVIAGGVAAALIGLNMIFQAGPVMVAAGPLLLWLGLATEKAFPFGAGLSLLLIGAALVIRFVGAPARPVFTAMGLLILFFWLLFAGNNVPGVSELEGDIDMFFLSGISMVVAGTFVLVYNADLMLGLLTLSGGLFSSLVPSIKTAVAYPLANKFRTGMTIAMISLVMFALVMFTTMNENFDRIFLSDGARGGYDVVVTENPGNPLPDLQQTLLTAGRSEDGGTPFGPETIAGIDDVKVANDQVVELDEAEREGEQVQEFESYTVYGGSDAFFANNTLTFQARATGFGSDREVWDALRDNPDYAVIDAFALGGGFDSSTISGIEVDATTFEELPVDVYDSARDTSRTVRIIGVLGVQASGLFGGMYLNEETFDAIYERPESTVHYVRLQPGVDSDKTAKAIESTLLARGAQADSLKKVIEEFQAQSRGFLLLFQVFMGIGLFVGIAAVGVIAFRTVVERRQQIGMLRAIGYTRRAIALSFLMESSFTALLGIGSGMLLGLLLANQLVKTDDFVVGGVNSFYIPWVPILAIAGFAFLASLIMTIIPSRQASSIPIAEALRYE